MKLTFVLQALRMGFLPRSNSAKLVPGMGGKDVDSVIGVSRYLVKYQKVIKSGRSYFEWEKWSCRGMSGHITGYRNIDRISLANSRLLSLGKSETGSLYFDL